MFRPLSVGPEPFALDPESVGRRFAALFEAQIGELLSVRLHHRIVASVRQLFEEHRLFEAGYSFETRIDYEARPLDYGLKCEHIDFRLKYENRCLRVRLSTCGIDVAPEWEQLPT